MAGSEGVRRRRRGEGAERRRGVEREAGLGGFLKDLSGKETLTTTRGDRGARATAESHEGFAVSRRGVPRAEQERQPATQGG